MLKFNKSTMIAIYAMLEIAKADGASVTSTEIAERHHISRHHLAKVLQQLVHKGILTGQRGPRGGYRLARERRRISVGEIVRVVRTVEGAEDPSESDQGSALGVKVVRPIWQEIQDDVMDRLDRLTVEELCDRARRENVPCEAPTVPDFSI